MSENSFNPNGIGINNGNLIGLPHSFDIANIVLIPAAWDVTTSYNAGTAYGPQNILKESLQLDVNLTELVNPWETGIYFNPINEKWLKLSNKLRPKVEAYIEDLEYGNTKKNYNNLIKEVNSASEALNAQVYTACKQIIDLGKIPAVVGGEHSVPLGLLQALNEKHKEFGVLHIDAHMDLRQAYEGFEYSHASIFNNAISKGFINKLIQVGIRDFCNEELEFAKKHEVKVFFDHDIKNNLYQGNSWHDQCKKIIEHLPEKVYVSFDIDGLNPHLCPNTGTPVPGGLEFTEATYLIEQLVKSGKQIIGFDLCEVAGNNAWDGNVGARILYHLCCWTAKSRNLI